MGLRFRTFRRSLLAFMSATAFTAVALAIYLLPYMSHPNMVWLLVSVQGLCLGRSLWSALGKPVLRRPQSVASETISLFCLLPFQLILALAILTISGGQKYLVLFVLQIVIFVGLAIHLIYTCCLIIVATITVCVFDKNVWIRDIDSSPSPFPMSILFSSIYPCLPFRSPENSRSSAEAHEEVRPNICVPGCACIDKLPAPTGSMMMHANTEAEAPIITKAGSQQRLYGSSRSLAESLIRIPTATEQRAWINVGFEVY
ncbi:hypothetical protein BD779DRAFT_958793 [Infundibulicybe gibba]|nr:hypothetical protein BD779DRAFT_958793 [Infundibulicybe gibba]